MRDVALVTLGAHFMPAVQPAFVGGVHHMAVVAGSGVVAQVHGEIADVSEHAQDDHECYDAD